MVIGSEDVVVVKLAELDVAGEEPSPKVHGSESMDNQ